MVIVRHSSWTRQRDDTRGIRARCGRRHPAQGLCPVKGSTYRRCGRNNHCDDVWNATEQTAVKQGRQHGNQRSSRGPAKSSHIRGKATVSTIDDCPDVDAHSKVFETISMHMDSMGDAQNCARDQVSSTWHSETSHGMAGRRNFERRLTVGHRETSFHCAFIRRCSPTERTKTGNPLETSWRSHRSGLSFTAARSSTS